MVNHTSQNIVQAVRLTELFELFRNLRSPVADLNISKNGTLQIAEQGQVEDNSDIFFDALTHQKYDTSDHLPLGHYRSDENPTSTTDSRVATFNTLDSFGRTPLSSAVAIDNSEAITALFSYGANTDIADLAGRTPLHIAAREGSLKAAKLLTGSGAKVDPRDNIGCTPLTTVIHSNQTDVALFLLQHGADISLRDYDDRSPIFYVIICNNESVIDAPLRRDCNATFIGNDGGTVLHTAAAHTTSSTISLLRSKLPQLSAVHLPNTRVLDKQGRTASTCARQIIELSNDPLYQSADFEDLLTAIKPRMKFEAGTYPKVSEQNKKAILALLTLLFYISTMFNPIQVVRGDMRNVRSVVSAWLIPLFSLGTLLEYIGSSFFWKRVIGFARRICAQPIPPNKVRVQWYCVGPEP